MSDRTVVVSDIHLGATPPDHERAFLSFLEEAPRWGEDLLIVGDLFDFWFEYGEVVPRGYLPALARLRALVEGGMTVRFLGGNHDAWGGSFLRDEVGLEVLDGPVTIRVGGRMAYVAHGDGLGGADWGYRILKSIIRSQVGRGLFRWIHPDLGVPLARRASGTEARSQGDPGVDSSRASRLTAHAAAVLSARPDLALVIFGHAHEPRLTEVEPGRHYLCAGDWIHHDSFAVVGPEEIRLEAY